MQFTYCLFRSFVAVIQNFPYLFEDGLLFLGGFGPALSGHLLGVQYLAGFDHSDVEVPRRHLVFLSHDDNLIGAQLSGEKVAQLLVVPLVPCVVGGEQNKKRREEREKNNNNKD